MPLGNLLFELRVFVPSLSLFQGRLGHFETMIPVVLGLVSLFEYLDP